MTLRSRVLLAIACLLAIWLGAGTATPCTTIIVGKGASADGCVLMAHNEDDDAPQAVVHRKVLSRSHAPGTWIRLSGGGALEQVPETAEFLWIDLPETNFSQSGLNEWGVCITSDNCPSREDRTDLTDGGIGPELRRIVIERARTAREGARLIGELVERFGYQASGRTYILSDPEEAWLVCLVRGRHWLAWRVPDDEVCVVPNCFVVRAVDPADGNQVMAAADIVAYAVKRGWYDPKRDGAFDFTRVYADPDRVADPTNYGRHWSALRYFSEHPGELRADLPAGVRPSRKIGVSDLMAALRDHYEGTALFHPDSSRGDPHVGGPGTVCAHATMASFVAQLRQGGYGDGDRPGEVQPGAPRGALPQVDLVLWTCLGRPCTSCFIPFHYGINDFPAAWQAGGASCPSLETWRSWEKPPFEVNPGDAFAAIVNAQARVGEDYRGRIGDLRRSLNAIEVYALARQGTFEAQARALCRTDPGAVSAMLLAFSEGVYEASVEARTRVLSR